MRSLDFGCVQRKAFIAMLLNAQVLWHVGLESGMCMRLGRHYAIGLSSLSVVNSKHGAAHFCILIIND